jgi:2-polyprenyl-3-methyl-5-hydroxy-6-metoxy-1,4-benzoquinol methylase
MNMRNFWDEQFSTEHFKYGTEPNAFLKEESHRFEFEGRILVPGDGEGRNGVWLAEQGFAVTTVDSSSVGIEKTKMLASSRGVDLSCINADLIEWDSSSFESSFDGVAIIYLHLPKEIRKVVYLKITDCLKPGGVLIIELFNPRQLGRPSGGPKDVSMLNTLDDLREIFVGKNLCEEIFGAETETELDEGPGHQGPAMVTRFIGRRIQ